MDNDENRAGFLLGKIRQRQFKEELSIKALELALKLTKQPNVGAALFSAQDVVEDAETFLAFIEDKEPPATTMQRHHPTLDFCDCDSCQDTRATTTEPEQREE